jgi:putative endonuclease
MSLAFLAIFPTITPMQPTVYILTNGSRTVLYTGVTSNLELRIAEHRSGVASKFTTKYRVDRLVYFETFQQMQNALDRKTAIKRKSRKGKVRMIDAMNPGWQELAT